MVKFTEEAGGGHKYSTFLAIAYEVLSESKLSRVCAGVAVNALVVFMYALASRNVKAAPISEGPHSDPYIPHGGSALCVSTWLMEDVSHLSLRQTHRLLSEIIVFNLAPPAFWPKSSFSAGSFFWPGWSVV